MRLVLLISLLAAAARAQSLEEKLAEKLQKPFASDATWVVRFADAKKQAAADGKLIFAYFTRSYAP